MHVLIKFVYMKQIQVVNIKEAKLKKSTEVWNIIVIKGSLVFYFFHSYP